MYAPSSRKGESPHSASRRRRSQGVIVYFLVLLSFASFSATISSRRPAQRPHLKEPAQGPAGVRARAAAVVLEARTLGDGARAQATRCAAQQSCAARPCACERPAVRAAMGAHRRRAGRGVVARDATHAGDWVR